MVPHHGTNWAALRLTAQIGRDAVLSESYGRGYWYLCPGAMSPTPRSPAHRRKGREDTPAARKVHGPSIEGLP